MTAQPWVYPSGGLPEPMATGVVAMSADGLWLGMLCILVICCGLLWFLSSYSSGLFSRRPAASRNLRKGRLDPAVPQEG
jgi:hypothetical protein